MYQNSKNKGFGIQLHLANPACQIPRLGFKMHISHERLRSLGVKKSIKFCLMDKRTNLFAKNIILAHRINISWNHLLLRPV